MPPSSAKEHRINTSLLLDPVSHEKALTKSKEASFRLLLVSWWDDFILGFLVSDAVGKLGNLPTQGCAVLCLVCAGRFFIMWATREAQRILEWVAMPPPGDLPNQGSNPGLPHCRWILYHLNHQGSPIWYTWSSIQVLWIIIGLQGKSNSSVSNLKHYLIFCWKITS